MVIKILTPMKPLIDYYVKEKLRMRVTDSEYFSGLIKKFLEENKDFSIHKHDSAGESHWASYFMKDREEYSIDLKFTLYDPKITKSSLSQSIDWDAYVWTVVRQYELGISRKGESKSIYDLRFGLSTDGGDFSIQPGRRKVIENPPLNLSEINEVIRSTDFSELGSLFAEPIKHGLGFMINYEGFDVMKSSAYSLPIDKIDKNSNDWSIRNLSNCPKK